MKHLKLLIGVLAVITLLALCSTPARAQQYSPTTLWSFAGTWTNVVGATTNLAAGVTLTKYDQFNLEFYFTGTNAAMTTTLGYSVAWQTSDDGVNWGTVDNHSRGWFSIPTTNAITCVWNTNITAGSYGYWRINYLTNSAGQCITNLGVRAYVKPKRNG